MVYSINDFGDRLFCGLYLFRRAPGKKDAVRGRMGVEGVRVVQTAEGLQRIAVNVEIDFGTFCNLFVGYDLKGFVQRSHHNPPLVLAIAVDVVQNGYLFVGPFAYPVDVFDQVDLEQVRRGKGQHPGLDLAQGELQWGMGEGDFDVLCLSREGFYFQVAITLKADQLF